ncbi:hypothetical protein ACO0LD_28810 [Undibacterium sp. Ji83W]|uniref:hypothetical protein n=1 Tax=Undibacterium sp. Ji83W TaxID=3413043 RepID=UPI003BF0B11B
MLGTVFNGYSSQHLKPVVARRYQELGMQPPVPHSQAPLEPTDVAMMSPDAK